MKDEVGKPIWCVNKNVDTKFVEFWPYNMETIHDTIKAITQNDEDNFGTDENKSGAV